MRLKSHSKKALKVRTLIKKEFENLGTSLVDCTGLFRKLIDSIPEDNPWHIAEASKVIINEDCNIGEDVVNQVEFSPDIDWEKWLFINDNNLTDCKCSNICSIKKKETYYVYSINYCKCIYYPNKCLCYL